MNCGPLSLTRVDGIPNLAKCAFIARITPVVRRVQTVNFPPAIGLADCQQLVFAAPKEQARVWHASQLNAICLSSAAIPCQTTHSIARRSMLAASEWDRWNPFLVCLRMSCSTITHSLWRLGHHGSGVYHALRSMPYGISVHICFVVWPTCQNSLFQYLPVAIIVRRKLIVNYPICNSSAALIWENCSQISARHSLDSVSAGSIPWIHVLLSTAVCWR